jgi:hypothetical protein
VKKGGIVLVSDLFDAPQDATRLQRTLLHVEEAGYPVRVVSLVPGSRDARFFANVLGKQAKVGAASSLPEPTRHTAPKGAFPAWLVAAAALLLVLLGANEALCGRLTWGKEPA